MDRLYTLVCLFGVVVSLIFMYMKNYCSKELFVKRILIEWKIQSNNGYIAKDDYPPRFVGDYYLSFTKKNDYDNHIHLHLGKKCIGNDNPYCIFYVLKRYNPKTNKIQYSDDILIDIRSNPRLVVGDMIERYEIFTS